MWEEVVRVCVRVCESETKKRTRQGGGGHGLRDLQWISIHASFILWTFYAAKFSPLSPFSPCSSRSCLLRVNSNAISSNVSNRVAGPFPTPYEH